jgi:hypothetical protein
MGLGPHRGRVRLLDPETERVTIDSWSLSPDGRTLRWRARAQAHTAPPATTHHLDIPTGDKQTSPAPHGLDEDSYGPGDLLCRAEFTDLDAGVWQHSTYALRSAGD